MRCVTILCMALCLLSVQTVMAQSNTQMISEMTKCTNSYAFQIPMQYSVPLQRCVQYGINDLKRGVPPVTVANKCSTCIRNSGIPSVYKPTMNNLANCIRRALRA